MSGCAAAAAPDSSQQRPPTSCIETSACVETSARLLESPTGHGGGWGLGQGCADRTWTYVTRPGRGETLRACQAGGGARGGADTRGGGAGGGRLLRAVPDTAGSGAADCPWATSRAGNGALAAACGDSPFAALATTIPSMLPCWSVGRYNRMVVVVRSRRLAHVPVDTGRVRMAMRPPLAFGRGARRARGAGRVAGTVRMTDHVHMRQWRRCAGRYEHGHERRACDPLQHGPILRRRSPCCRALSSIAPAVPTIRRADTDHTWPNTVYAYMHMVICIPV